MLSALLDAVELMAPELFKGLDPVMHSFQLLRFEVVDALFALLDHRDHADLAQHAQVLRDRRLRKPQREYQRSHSQGPAPRQQLDNLPPTLLEICGPLMMSYPAVNHLQYRLTAEGGVTRLAFLHRGMGLIQPEHRDGLPKGWEHWLERIRELAERKNRKETQR